ncbi:hypothetical protein [Actinomadura formosensis]|uniref:hypothetical protein n=1 Tax=Actinomadura formosensis TaxID=60706 RepID=UPI0008377674|nr:hypothetical protein [Actinomadura formosensis]
MPDGPQRLPSSWAEVCALKDRLRALAKRSGHLTEWRNLDEAARRRADTLREWRALAAKITEHGVLYGSYGIRDGLDGAGEPVYRCPGERHCDRVARADDHGRAPMCHLAGTPMTRAPGPERPSRD